MVDMTHDRHDRRARHELALVVLLLADSLLYLSTDILGLETELVSHQVDGLSIEALVDRSHHTDTHQCGDDLVDTYVHHRGKFRDGNKLR